MTRWYSLCVALAAVLCSCAERAPQIAPVSVATRLLSDTLSRWRTVSIEGVRLHFAQGAPADSLSRRVTDSVKVIRRELLTRLGVSTIGDTADLFFLSSREEMQRLARRPLAGFVQQGEPTGVFVVTPGYRYGSLLRHELTHLYTFAAWGAPRAGRWLVEGVAAWSAGKCQGHTAHELASGIDARKALVSLTQLARDFERVPEEIAMPEAGSAVTFLVQNEGLEAVRALWKDAVPPGHPVGERGAAFEAAWRDEIRRATPRNLDVSRLIIQGC